MPVIQFKGKTAIESYHHTIPHHTLKFDPKLSLLPKGEKPNLDGNIIIGGDNLLALKALLPTHARRIKCIYIDPPYNTGNEDWVYNDNLTQPQFSEWIGRTVGKDGEDFTRHDKWCCMMYPRLALLKELLRDDGAIFVSIDDNEAHHLRMLLDEIFGPENFVAQIIWKKRSTPPNDQIIGANHEYIFCFARDKKQVSLNLRERTEEQRARYKNPDNHPKGPWTPGDLMANVKGGRYVKSLYFPIKNPNTGEDHYPSSEGNWRFNKDKIARLLADNEISFGEDGKGRPKLKRFLADVKEGVTYGTIWDFVPLNTEGSAEMHALFGDMKAFENPKPSGLLVELFRLGTEANDLILDSFAGSGTTGHAILKLNNEDGGNRKFILIQQPFDTKKNEQEQFNITRKITAERIRRAIRGYEYTTPAGKNARVAGLSGAFTYSEIGPILFSEYRDFGRQLPPYEELAKYIFYTETSTDFDKKYFNERTGKIGEYRKTSYYLLYTANNREDRELDLKWLKSIEKTEEHRNIVVYCEKIWIHRDDLAKYEKQTGRKVRPMIVPFNLK
jgi:DNA modification methylase